MKWIIIIISYPFKAATVIVKEIVSEGLASFVVGLMVFLLLIYGLIALIWPPEPPEYYYVRKSMHSCRIVEIQLQHPCQKGVANSGIITYLTDNEVPVASAFVNLSTMELTSESGGAIYIKDSSRGENWQKWLFLEGLSKIKFEIIPYVIMRSWPKRFLLDAIPEIKVEVEYLNGGSLTHTTYATDWIYFYEKIPNRPEKNLTKR